MTNQNIFSALAKYNSAVDENYLTEAFVHVIQSLLNRDRTIGYQILNHLCFNDNDTGFSADEVVTITTQVVTNEGTPDIQITGPDKLIFVEVKHDSSLGYKQISRYKHTLDTSEATIKHVVLLTRYIVDYESEEEKPYKHVCWFEIYNWLDSLKEVVTEPINTYLIDEFKSFLEVKQMSMQKVGWEFINGIQALNNLMSMVEVAIKNNDIPFYPAYPRSAGWNFKGFLMGDKDYWCGIHFENPEIVTFELQDKTKFDKAKLENPTYELREGKERLWFRLPLDKIHFFSLDKDEQLEEITKFVRIAYNESQQMRF